MMGQMAAAPTPAVSGDNINMVINPSPGMDERALARYAIQEYLRESRSAKERR